MKRPLDHTPLFLSLIASMLGTACTQIPDSFRLQQQEEAFSSVQEVNTKLDMLWVIDNSGSMAPSQQRIREGFANFAARYMKPTWDIRVAVITTDTYFAHPAFNEYLNSTHTNNSYKSNYLVMTPSGSNPVRQTPFVNPSWAPNLLNLNPASSNYGKFTSGLKINQANPAYGPDYAKLLPGKHDGPIPVLCFERTALLGNSRCAIRDDERANIGPSRCVFPGPGESSVSQCVNTTMNDTVRSGKPIISTQPPLGVAADSLWTQQLYRDFLVNLSVGVTGSGLERGLGSMLQMISDNESPSSPSRFFRPDSLRVVVLVGDEDDQTMVIPNPAPAGFSPTTDMTGSCPQKTIDGYTYRIPICPGAGKLVPVATIKNQLDNFFLNLDERAENPNYFVATITPLNGASIEQLHLESGGSTVIDRADRFLELGRLVGNGSLEMDLTAADYTPMLEQIGRAIVEKKAVFELRREPTAEEDMIVYVRHQNGSRTYLRYNQFSIAGRFLTITDLSFVLGLASTDQVVISYQPRSL